MIGYVKGIVSHLFLDSCFVDVNGVGYRVFIPGSTREELTTGHEALLFTYMSVREDAIVLYGFYTQDEYDLFILLIAVNGIGPKAALGILSAVHPDGFRLAVQQKNMAVLTKISGIGKKTAERIILELQDKVGTADITTAAVAAEGSAAPQGIMEEALAALTSLGYTTQEVLPVLQEKASQCDSVESLLKASLRVLGSGR